VAYKRCGTATRQRPCRIAIAEQIRRFIKQTRTGKGIGTSPRVVACILDMFPMCPLRKPLARQPG